MELGIDIDTIYAAIGRLYVENMALRARMAAGPERDAGTRLPPPDTAAMLHQDLGD